MTIGVNGWRMQGVRTGVGRYLYNVLRHWTREMVPPGVRIVFHSALPVAEQLPDTIEIRIHASTARMLPWENLRLGPAIKDDVLLCPSYSRPLFTRSRTVVTTHDAVSKRNPELFPISQRWLYNPLYGWSARHAALVITDSSAAREDIVRLWKVPPQNIRVIYLAPAESFRPCAQVPELLEARRRLVGSDEPFFLFVGKMSGRRSIPILLDAFALFRKRGIGPHLLCLVGPPSAALDLRAQLASNNLESSVRILGYLSDLDLNLLYNAAEALVMPAVYETVSLPVMEAQAAGTAVICIDTAGMRDITGEASCRVAHLDADLLCDALERVAGDSKYREMLRARGLENAARFSWRKTSQQTLEALLAVASR